MDGIAGLPEISAAMKFQGIGVSAVLLGLMFGVWLTLKVVKWALRNYEGGY